MTEVIAEFSGFNNLSFKRAFTQACEDVSAEGGVAVIDAIFAKPEARDEIDLAVYTAGFVEIFDEPCTGALRDLVERQVKDVRLVLGVAATGVGALEEDARALAISLGHQPPGVMREVVASPELGDLYRHIVGWLEVVIASRLQEPTLGDSLARDAGETMAENLPTSDEAPPLPKKLRIGL